MARTTATNMSMMSMTMILGAKPNLFGGETLVGAPQIYEYNDDDKLRCEQTRTCYSDQPHMPPLHRDPVINHFRYKDYPMPGSLICDLIVIVIVNPIVIVIVLFKVNIIIIPIPIVYKDYPIPDSQYL